MGIHLARALSLSDENGQDNENIRHQKRRRAHNETGTIPLLFKTQMESNDCGYQIER